MACFAALSPLSCGYRPAYGNAPELRLSVGAAPFATPHPEALEAMLSGVRAGLSQAGALSSGNSYPRVVVELLRVDELPAGIAIVSAPQETALGRGSAVGVVARAWVVARAGGPPMNETGDVRRVDYVAQGSAPVVAGAAYGMAVESAARQVGEALARRILGFAEPGSGPL